MTKETLADFIREYHRTNKIPVFNKATHGKVLREAVPEYAKNSEAAIKRFADDEGFKVEIGDHGFRFSFDSPSRGDEVWQKEVVKIEE